MGQDIRELEEKLALQLEMINQTESWWAILISKKISRHRFLTNKLQQTFDSAMLPEIEQLEREISHLKSKSIWEQNEMQSFEKKQENFESIKRKALMSELSNKLSKKMQSKRGI